MHINHLGAFYKAGSDSAGLDGVLDLSLRSSTALLVQAARDHPLNNKAMTHGVSRGSLMVLPLQRIPFLKLRY